MQRDGIFILLYKIKYICKVYHAIYLILYLLNLPKFIYLKNILENACIRRRIKLYLHPLLIINL